MTSLAPAPIRWGTGIRTVGIPKAPARWATEVSTLTRRSRDSSASAVSNQSGERKVGQGHPLGLTLTGC